ncbi:hypothetical protein C8R47DRAFT_1089606 [Mycena vitilis]|nr:hypothetical protein C8R47DRAFT_1089606 [Mycena vitilis]
MNPNTIQDPSSSKWAQSSSPSSSAHAPSTLMGYTSSTPSMYASGHNQNHSPWRTSPMISPTMSDFEQPRVTTDPRRRPQPRASPQAQTARLPEAHNINVNGNTQDVSAVNTNNNGFRPPSPAPRFRLSPLENVSHELQGLPQHLPPPPGLRPLSGPLPPRAQPIYASLQPGYIQSLVRALPRDDRTAIYLSDATDGDAFSMLADPDDGLEEMLQDDEDALYLTSPREFVPGLSDSLTNTPQSSYMGTPSFGGGRELPSVDGAESPVIAAMFVDYEEDYAQMALFAGTEYDDVQGTQHKLMPSESQKMRTYSPSTPALQSFDEFSPSSLWSTGTDAPVIPPPPQRQPQPTLRATRARASRAKPGKHTGTRRNATLKSLIPLDAPTQKRQYKTPSQTSAKPVPAFAKNTIVAWPGDGDDDGEGEKPPSPTASEREKIEFKRRMNTVAARRSRARRLAQKEEMEEEVGRLRTELAMWRERARMAQDMLGKSGTNLGWEEDAEAEAE